MPGNRVIDTNGKDLFVPINPGLVQVVGSNATDGQTLWTPGMLYNETTSDKPRGNTQGTLLASAARTGTTYSANQTNYNARGVLLFLSVTAVPVTPGAGGLLLKLLTPDPTTTSTGSGVNLDLPLITATGLNMYMIYPGASAATGASSSVKQFTPAALPRTWSVQIYQADTQSYTYSIGYSLIV